jgi:hypothetical protein
MTSLDKPEDAAEEEGALIEFLIMLVAGCNSHN